MYEKERASVAWCAFFTLGLSACVAPLSPPDLGTPLPSGWTNADFRPSDATRIQTAARWGAFEDTVLERLVRQALTNNPDIAQSYFNLEAARALERSARAVERSAEIMATAQSWHQNRLSGEGSPSSGLPIGGGTLSYYETGFDARWELDLFGRLSGGRDVARAERNIARADLEAIRMSVAAEVARTYFELRAARTRRAAFRRIIAYQTQLSNVAGDRRAAGLIDGIAFDRLETERAATQALLPREEDLIDQAERRLAILTGTTAIPTGDLARGRQSLTGAVSVDRLPAELLRARPDVVAAEQAVVKAAAEAGVARAELYPRLTFGGTLQATGDLVGAPLGGSSVAISGGPALSLPLFDWGQRRAIVDARDMRVQASAQAYRSTLLKAWAEAEGALSYYAAARARAERLNNRVAATAREVETLAARQRQGLVDSVDILEARIAHERAQLELADARCDQSTGLVAIFKALAIELPPTAAPPAVLAAARKEKRHAD